METKKENSRRKFIKTATKAAVVAPAAGVILSAASKPAEAFISSGCYIQPGQQPDCIT